MESSNSTLEGSCSIADPILYIVIPCYNEDEVLPITAKQFEQELNYLIQSRRLSSRSRILFVDDGSKDSTWSVIQTLSSSNPLFCGVSLSRNRGHQNALFAGLMVARKHCDVSISIDCDGQDDIHAMELMVDEYLAGCDVVYGVRSSRATDSLFKRSSAQLFYKFMEKMGAESVYNHADYRLLSSKVLDELSRYREVNLYLRGMIPLIGFKSTCVYYERHERIAGESHYPLKKMLELAINGITRLSAEPITIISKLGWVVTVLSLFGVVWAIVNSVLGLSVAGWPTLLAAVCLLGGIQLLSIGVIGEYVGKIYIESKRRPRFILDDSVNIQDDLPHDGDVD